MKLSVVIPAFNEAGRIGANVARVRAYLDAQPYDAEVIVVLDGGRAGAAEIAAAVPSRADVRVLDNGVNRGKGFSVRRGMVEAHGRYRLFIDADLSLPIEGTGPLLAALERGADVAIGSRAVEGARVTGDRARFRTTMGRAFNLIVRSLAVPGVHDTQCGFKGFTAEAADRIFRVQRLDRFGFDVEVLRLARRFGFTVAEVPVSCVYHGGSSVRRVWDAASMLIDVGRVRWNEVTGRYGPRRVT